MPEYNSNPNQRCITTHKELTNNESEENYYAKINLNALRNAMSTLSPKAFELWTYFSKNQDNHYFWLSKTDFLSWSNIKSTSYYEAFKELEERNYLVKRSVRNHYDFYETPKEESYTIHIHKD